MINPPFPYNVVITRSSSSDPFSEEGAFSVIYEGKCDWENNRFPTYKDNVQTDKYILYIPDKDAPIKKQDKISLEVNGNIIEGEIMDFIPTNFGLTIRWSNVNN